MRQINPSAPKLHRQLFQLPFRRQVIREGTGQQVIDPLPPAVQSCPQLWVGRCQGLGRRQEVQGLGPAGGGGALPQTLFRFAAAGEGGCRVRHGEIQ
jgi:hypothetical protein